MDSQSLRATQAPLKEKYQTNPDAAVVRLRAEANGSAGIACKIDTGVAMVEAGLHPATGGDGSLACSGDMLLEALVACAGVTFQAVATAFEIADAFVVPSPKEAGTALAVAVTRSLGFPVAVMTID